MRIARHGELHAALAMVDRMRRDALFLRLSGGARSLALLISPVYFANVDEVRTSLLHRNRGKVVGPQSYTPEEIKRLESVRFNVVRMM